MYSSKEKMILLPVKFLDESGGDAFINCGAIESLGPPDGGMILAHPVAPKIAIITVIRIEINAIKNLTFMQMQT